MKSRQFKIIIIGLIVGTFLLSLYNYTLIQKLQTEILVLRITDIQFAGMLDDLITIIRNLVLMN